MFPKQSFALWGSGALKAGETYVAPARHLGASFSSQTAVTATLRKQSGCGSSGRVPPTPVLEPQALYFRKTPVAAELGVLLKQKANKAYNTNDFLQFGVSRWGHIVFYLFS